MAISGADGKQFRGRDVPPMRCREAPHRGIGFAGSPAPVNGGQTALTPILTPILPRDSTLVYLHVLETVQLGRGKMESDGTGNTHDR